MVAHTHTYKCKTPDLGFGMAESHGGAIKIVAECELCESEVEVVEEEEHGSST